MLRNVSTIALLAPALLHSGCSQDQLSRTIESRVSIIGGERMQDQNDPLVRASVALDDSSGQHECSGTIIKLTETETVVLTAAHCFIVMPLRFVRFGALGMHQESVRFEDVTPLVPEFFSPYRRFESFPGRLWGDIAVLTIPVRAPDRAIALPLAKDTTISAGDRLLVVGSGIFDPITRHRGSLHKTNLEVVEVNERGGEFVVKDPAERSATCSGDSGGPALIATSAGHFSIIGVDSRPFTFQEDCQGRTIYTDVRPYSDLLGGF